MGFPSDTSKKNTSIIYITVLFYVKNITGSIMYIIIISLIDNVEV